MNAAQSAETGDLYLKQVASLVTLNKDITLSCGLSGVKLLDFGCIDYETPKQLSGQATSLGGNYIITDGPLPKGFLYNITGWGSAGGSTDWNSNHDEEPYIKYGSNYLFVRFYGSYMNEIERFNKYPCTECSICK